MATLSVPIPDAKIPRLTVLAGKLIGPKLGGETNAAYGVRYIYALIKRHDKIVKQQDAVAAAQGISGDDFT